MEAPTCGRCEARGIICEARSPKRSNEAASRQLRLERRPITIAPYPAHPRSAFPSDSDYHSDPTQWTASAQSQYALTPSSDGYNSSSPIPSATGFQANPQNYLYRPSYLADAYASGQSSYGPQLAQVPATSVSQYYSQAADPSVAPSMLGWASPYSVANTAAPFSTSSGSHQNANFDQASQYPTSEAYAYGRGMSLEFSNTTRPSTDRDSFGEFGFGGTGMQTPYMTSYPSTMPESSDYYRPA